LAIKPKDNETFYREVDEELRRDRARTLWERYGRLAILGVVLLLAAIAGAIWWNNQKQVAAGKRGAELVAALEEMEAGNKGAALPRLDALSKSGEPGYEAAASLAKADLALRSNDTKGAAGIYRQMSGDQALDQVYRDLALVRLTHLEFDTLINGKAQTVVDRMKPLAVSGNPWFGSAGEMVGIAYIKLNKPREAAATFAALAKDEGVPSPLRSRARQMAESLGSGPIADPDEAAQEGTQ
jgi:hypothetical protein